RVAAACPAISQLSLHDALPIFGGSHDILGECPIWSVREGALYWIDVRAPAIRRRIWTTGEVTTWTMPELVGSFGLRASKPGLIRSEEHTSELQSREKLVCRLLL